MRKLAAIAVLVVAPAVMAAQVRVEMIDTAAHAGELKAINDGQLTLVVEGQGQRQLPLGDVATLSFAEAPEVMKSAGAVVIEGVAGDLLSASDLSLSKEGATFNTRTLGKRTVELSKLRAIYMPAKKSTPEAVAEEVAKMKLPSAQRDRLVVQRPSGAMLSADGVIKSMDETHILFQWKGSDGKMARNMLRKIELAVLGERPETAGTLTARDGSVLGFSSIESDGKAVTIETPLMGKVKLGLDKVAAVRLVSSRVVNLSELKPAAVKQHGMLDRSFPYKVDRSVGGGPLLLGKRQFSTGLGLHSFCELSWKLDGKYEVMVAVAGIDDAATGGDAILTVLVDGKPAGDAMRLTGGEKPVPIRIELDGAEELAVRVDFGPDKLDVGDHVDLAGARLIRKAAETTPADETTQE